MSSILQCSNNLCLCSWIFNWPNMFTRSRAYTSFLFRSVELEALSFVKCALALHCGSSPYSQRTHATLSTYVFITIFVTVSVPWVVNFWHFLFVCNTGFYQLNRKKTICTFFLKLLQCTKSHVCHIYVFVTKFTGWFKFILLYTPKHMKWLFESAFSSRSALKCLFYMTS